MPYVVILLLNLNKITSLSLRILSISLFLISLFQAFLKECGQERKATQEKQCQEVVKAQTDLFNLV
jgi:hypothetical protein